MPVLNKKQAQAKIDELGIDSTFVLSYGNTSNIITVKNMRGDRIEGLDKVGGYGYDKQGTALANYMKKFFFEEITKLNASKFYGLEFYNTITKKRQNRYTDKCGLRLDGACGWGSVLDVLNAIGLNMEFIAETKLSTVYKLRVI